jgi:hypothetical protein
MSARGARPEPEDTLIDAGPAGHLSAEGWRDSTTARRAERLLFESQERVRQASSALAGGMFGSQEERVAALAFVASGLRHQARLIDRARRVLSCALDRAEERAEERAETCRRLKAPPGPRAPRTRAKAQLARARPVNAP